MTGYVLGRLTLLLPTLLGVSLIVFVVMRLLPGDVVEVTLGSAQNVTEQQKDQLRHDLGLQRSLPRQYVDWMGGLLRLDAGKSILTKAPISGELKHRVPVTVELALGAVIVSTLVAVPAGVISAVYQDRPLDYAVRVLTILRLALPILWVQILLRNLVLPQYVGCLPPAGYTDPWTDPSQN